MKSLETSILHFAVFFCELVRLNPLNRLHFHFVHNDLVSPQKCYVFWLPVLPSSSFSVDFSYFSQSEIVLSSDGHIVCQIGMKWVNISRITHRPLQQRFGSNTLMVSAAKKLYERFTDNWHQLMDKGSQAPFDHTNNLSYLISNYKCHHPIFKTYETLIQ